MPPQLINQAIPVTLICLVTLGFFILERIRPGRELPHVQGWYWRAALMNVIQVALIGAGGLVWNRFFRDHTLFNLGNWSNPMLEGAFYWFVGTFIFYWWHRLRHANGFWRIFHQIHHSPSRKVVFVDIKLVVHRMVFWPLDEPTQPLRCPDV